MYSELARTAPPSTYYGTCLHSPQCTYIHTHNYNYSTTVGSNVGDISR